MRGIHAIVGLTLEWGRLRCGESWVIKLFLFLLYFQGRRWDEENVTPYCQTTATPGNSEKGIRFMMPSPCGEACSWGIFSGFDSFLYAVGFMASGLQTSFKVHFSESTNPDIYCKAWPREPSILFIWLRWDVMFSVRSKFFHHMAIRNRRPRNFMWTPRLGHVSCDSPCGWCLSPAV